MFDLFAHPPPLQAVSNEQVEHITCRGRFAKFRFGAFSRLFSFLRVRQLIRVEIAKRHLNTLQTIVQSGVIRPTFACLN
jgi:hypothetical protein